MERIKQYLSKRRAAAGAVKMFSGNLTPRSEAQLHRWRNESLEYQICLVESAHILSDLEQLADDPELLAVVEKPAAIRSKTRRQYNQFWPYLTAASLLLMVFAGIYVFWQKPSEDNHILRYVTRTGEQRQVKLADGSTVTLNTATRLLVDISNTSRRIVLERGEAWFDVMQDPQRPFTVDLGNRAITALGTAFNILRSPGKFTLSVTEGVVAIHRMHEQPSNAIPALDVADGEVLRLKTPDQHRLKAGTVAEFDIDKQELSVYHVADIERMQSWRNGIISFNAEPLSSVVQELNRYSGKKILIGDADIMNLKLYATVRLKRVDAAITGLENSLPVKVISYVDRYEIVKREN